MLESHNCYNTTPFSLSGRTVNARVVSIYDGDTITAIIEVYPGNFCQFKFRLANIDTPEMLGEHKHEAKIARDRTIKLITGHDVGKMSRGDIKEFLNSNLFKVYIKCLHFEKYGRVLAHVYTDESMTLSINEILVTEGLAKPYMVNH
jgi:micrococcal nuclease